jgi:hypothetical protein
MMTAEQLCSMCNSPQYKKTKGCLYNFKYSKEVVASPNFSFSDLLINGIPGNQVNFISSISILIFKWIFRKNIISKELGEIRNSIIEVILNSSLVDNFDISVFMHSKMNWIKDNREKLEYMKDLTMKFTADINIQLLLFRTMNITTETERNVFMKDLNNKINYIFDNKIAEVMKGIILNSEIEYNKYFKTHNKTLSEHIINNGRAGNLTESLSNPKKEEKSND